MRFRGGISTIVRHPAAPALMALGISALLSPLYQYRLNPDALSYLGIAQDIAHGSVRINTYWSPLFSWLLAPFIAAGIPELLSLKLLCAVCAGFATAAGTSLFRVLPMGTAERMLCRWTLAIITIGWAMGVTTPDLLLSGILGFALAVALHPQFPASKWSGPIFGALGVVAFFTKSVALPLFVVAIPLLWLAWRWMGMRNHLSRTMMISVVVLLIGCAPWIALISKQTGHFTIGEAGPMIHASEAPGSAGLPITTQGLLEPETGMLSIWQDPGNLPRISWSAFDSITAFKHQIILLARNMQDAAAHLLGFTVFAFALLAGGLLLALRHGRTHARLAAALLTGACVINVAPYLPILVDARYLWGTAIVLIGLTGMLIAALREHAHLTVTARSALLMLSFGSFLVLPIPELLLGANDGSAFARQAMTTHSRMSNKRIAADVWKTGLYFSYYVDGTYLGTPKPNATPEDIERELLLHNVDAYITWKGAIELRHYTEQPTVSGGPRIYLRTGAS